MPNPLSMDRLSDSTSLPKLWKEAEPANVAGTDYDGRLFRVPVAVPLKGTWDSPWDDRVGVLWNHHRN